MTQPTSTPYSNFLDVFNAPHSSFFSGSTRDTLFDRQSGAALSPSSEAMFTQSNGRVLVGQSANGNFRLIAIPTQVYPAPTAVSEFGLGPGMYYRSDVVMYAGDLHYKISLDDESEFDLGGDERQNHTWYAEHFLPLTTFVHPGLDIHTLSLAPLAAEADRAALAPAPFPGPAGAIYALHLRNKGQKTLHGKIVLEASDLLVGHYEDAEPAAREMNRSTVNLRQRTLFLSCPFGAVGIHLHDGQWIQTTAPFLAERTIHLEPGQEVLVETHLAIGASYAEVLPVIFELHLHSALDWLNHSAAYWRERLGNLSLEAAGATEQARFMQEVYIRSLFDNFNCLQTDAQGKLLIHWQGAPSHGYGVCWGIDVEPTAVSLVHLCPQITRQVMLFFMNRSRAPIGPKDHSVPILVAPVIIARQWLQVSGDVNFLATHPEVLAALKSILDELLALKAPGEDLFPSRFSSDGSVGRRYDFGANVKVLYAFDSLAYLLQKTGRESEALVYQGYAEKIHSAIQRWMVVEGPFGPQISGGTNLDKGTENFYLPENFLYYDGEDTSSMLAPLYGACDLDWQPWINYHRFARSLWCPTYDPEFGMLNWFPSEPAVQDGTAFFSRLGGSLSPEEMLEAVEILKHSGVDEVTGSVFWWPHGLEYKRSLTRCSQGQGAWAWQYLQQWLGISVDRTTRTLVLAPRGLITSFTWSGFHSGENHFDLAWEETASGSIARITNHNVQSWQVKSGFRIPGSGATDQLTWKIGEILPGEEIIFNIQSTSQVGGVGHLPMTEIDIRRKETLAFSQDPELLFMRYGPAMLWGHWEASKYWQPTELPNSLRFIIVNNGKGDWQDVNVNLSIPEGWKAQPRQPQRWPKPDQLHEGQVSLTLGRLAAGCHTVAPFWIQAPSGRGLLSPVATGFFGSISVSSHTPSQPGEGLHLVSPGLLNRQEVQFTAQLTANSVSGKKIQATRVVPVILDPA